jgi:hypothetical protein
MLAGMTACQKTVRKIIGRAMKDILPAFKGFHNSLEFPAIERWSESANLQSHGRIGYPVHLIFVFLTRCDGERLASKLGRTFIQFIQFHDKLSEGGGRDGDFHKEKGNG